MSNDGQKRAVGMAMRIMVEEFGDRFKISESRTKIWRQMLSEFDGDTILAAAYHLASTEEWAPPIAKMRRACVELSSGEVHTLAAPEAWARVSQHIQGGDIALTEIEQEALKQTGTLWTLRRSTNPTLDRAHFCRAYDALVKKRDRLRTTLPKVRQFAESNTPALPERTHKQPPEPQNDTVKPVDKDWLKRLLRQTVERLEVQPSASED